jgi:hypothetical protein
VSHVADPGDVTNGEIRAISLILQQLDRLGAHFQGREESRLLRFALTDAFNAGARAAATVTGASVTTLLSDLPSLLEEEIAHRSAAD